MKDMRWKQRYNNYIKALEQLASAVNLDTYNDLEREGLIQRFEYTYELAWLTIKDYLEDQGFQNITGSKDAFRQANNSGIISNADKWMEMIESRKLTTHTYDKDTAMEIAEKIVSDYFLLFKGLNEVLKSKINDK